MLMPDELLRPPDRTLGHIAVGETVFTRANTLVVTADKQGYLIPSKTEFGTEPEDYALKIYRDEQGFHITVRDRRTWLADVDPRLAPELIPVASITLGFNGQPTYAGAKLPSAMVKKPEPSLEDLPLGGVGFVGCSDLRVTADCSCYLRPEAKFESRPGNFFNLRVSRDDAGFHLTILNDLISWKPDTPTSLVDGWIPVLTVAVELDPALGRSSKK